MGRIKTTLIKRTTLQIFKENREELTKDFNKNKEIVAKLADIPSKKLRNIIAGYATRLVRKE